MYHSVTGVGGTTSIPEVAVDFSAGGFSNLVGTSTRDVSLN